MKQKPHGNDPKTDIEEKRKNKRRNCNLAKNPKRKFK